jgi:hypothetical protein
MSLSTTDMEALRPIETLKFFFSLLRVVTKDHILNVISCENPKTYLALYENELYLFRFMKEATADLEIGAKKYCILQ